MNDLKFFTARLQLGPLDKSHAEFILELVNTPGWLRFIGDRNVKNRDDAENYIRSILDNPKVKYWVVCTKPLEQPIGIVTLINRDYLPQPDIGFAFLPQYAANGYAFEAAKAIMERLLTDSPEQVVFAVSIAENTRSIALLEKLGLSFDHTLTVEDEKLLVYSTAPGHFKI